MADPRRTQPARPAAVRATAATAVGLMVIGAGAVLGMHGAGGRSTAAVSGVVKAGSAAAGTLAANPYPAASTTTVPDTTTTPATAAPEPSGGIGASPAAGADVSTLSVPATTVPHGAAPSVTAVAGPAGDPPPAATAAASGGPAPATTPSGGPSGSTAPLVPPAPPVPPAGSYSYATTGGSQISVLGSTSYPATTTVVVSDTGCGVALTWNSSPGNSDTTVECPVPGGMRVVSDSLTVASHGFRETQTFNCDGTSFIPVDTGSPGQTWRWGCTSGNGESSAQVVTFVGRRTSTVGGVPLSTVEVTVDSTLSGPEQGTVATTYVLSSDGLPVSENGTVTASADALGYRSQYSLQLLALRPS